MIGEAKSEMDKLEEYLIENGIHYMRNMKGGRYDWDQIIVFGNDGDSFGDIPITFGEWKEIIKTAGGPFKW